jgi:hypothetical protein
LDKLREREAARKEAARPPAYLTDEEKQLTMDQLARKWKVERQRQQNLREELRAQDFAPLGSLTEEQKLLPRNDVRRIVMDRKSEVWAENMRARGFEVLRCATCQRLHLPGKHECFKTSWVTEATRNTPVQQTVIVSKTTQGVQVRRTPVIDEEQVLASFEKYRVMKEEIEARQRATPNQPLPIVEEVTTEQSSVSDAPMTSGSANFGCYTYRRDSTYSL